jgi:hypothetical protein
MAADCKSAAPCELRRFESSPVHHDMDEDGPGEREEREHEGAPPETDLSVRSPARKWIALALMAAVAGLAWKTMDPGKVRTVVLLLLAVFGFRIAVSSSR